jgi:hypothetical protein
VNWWEYAAVDTVTMTADVCKSTTRAVPVDTQMNVLYMLVSGTDDLAKPTLQLVDANGKVEPRDFAPLSILICGLPLRITRHTRYANKSQREHARIE